MSVLLVGALVGAFCGGGVLGAVAAWWAHRRTRAVGAQSVRAGAPLGLLLWLGALALRRPELLPLGALVVAAGLTAAVSARRYRLAALGAGGELREFELARHSLPTALGRERRVARRRERAAGHRTRIAGQGELVRERGWPVGEPFVPMTADPDGARVPSRAGKHLLIVGATGSGKTVSARRWLLGRILADGVATLATDPKGDVGLEADLRAAARLVGRLLVVFDPRDPVSDRWNPLWSQDTGAVVSRLVAPISAGEATLVTTRTCCRFISASSPPAYARPGCGRRTCRCCWRRRSCRTSSAWRSSSARVRAGDAGGQWRRGRPGATEARRGVGAVAARVHRAAGPGRHGWSRPGVRHDVPRLPASVLGG